MTKCNFWDGQYLQTEKVKRLYLSVILQTGDVHCVILMEF